MGRIVILALLLLSVAVFPTAGAQSYSQEWTEEFDGEGIGSTVQSTDDGYVVTGDPFFALSPSEESSYRNKAWLLKLNTDGGLVWNETYGNGGFVSLDQTSDGGYVMLGSTIKRGSSVPLLIKADSGGREEWRKVINNSRMRSGSVAHTDDGGYVLAGKGFGEDKREDGIAGTMVWVMKTDAEGDREWVREYETGARVDYTSIVQTEGGRYIVAGGSANTGTPGFGGFVIGLNSEGGRVWERKYDRGTLRTVSEVSGDEYVAAGQGIFGVSNSEGCELCSWIVRLDSDGNVVWNRTYDYVPRSSASNQFELNGAITSVAAADDGGVVATMGSSSFSDRLRMMEVNEDGEVTWNRTFGNTSYIPSSLARGPEGGYVVSGAKGRIASDSNLRVTRIGKDREDNGGAKLPGYTALTAIFALSLYAIRRHQIVD
jgi:hypothetical protein